MSADGEAKLLPKIPEIFGEIEGKMTEVAGEPVMFALFVFGDGEIGAGGAYAMNCERADVARQLRKLLDIWERQDTPSRIGKAH